MLRNEKVSFYTSEVENCKKRHKKLYQFLNKQVNQNKIPFHRMTLQVN